MHFTSNKLCLTDENIGVLMQIWLFYQNIRDLKFNIWRNKILIFILQRRHRISSARWAYEIIRIMTVITIENFSYFHKSFLHIVLITIPLVIERSTHLPFVSLWCINPRKWHVIMQVHGYDTCWPGQNTLILVFVHSFVPPFCFAFLFICLPACLVQYTTKSNCTICKNYLKVLSLFSSGQWGCSL